MSPETLQRHVIVFEEAMAIRRKAEEAGIFDPSELALLARTFQQLKLEGQSTGQREALASRIIATTWPA
ncbi:hypothetical protein [Mesorhizobium sp. BHbdii]